MTAECEPDSAAGNASNVPCSRVAELVLFTSAGRESIQTDYNARKSGSTHSQLMHAIPIVPRP